MLEKNYSYMNFIEIVSDLNTEDYKLLESNSDISKFGIVFKRPVEFIRLLTYQYKNKETFKVMILTHPFSNKFTKLLCLDVNQPPEYFGFDRRNNLCLEVKNITN